MMLFNTKVNNSIIVFFITNMIRSILRTSLRKITYKKSIEGKHESHNLLKVKLIRLNKSQ